MASAESTLDIVKKRGHLRCQVGTPSPGFYNLDAAGEFPNARRFAALGLTLPSGPDQTEDDLHRTVEVLRDLDGEIDTRLDV